MPYRSIFGAGLAIVTAFLTIFLLPESHKPVAQVVHLKTIAAALRAPDLVSVVILTALHKAFVARG